MNLREYLKQNIVVIDGAMGTMIQLENLKIDKRPETLNITANDEITAIHSAYVDAGADVITSNTFGANELKLADTGYTVEEVIEAGISACKKASESSSKPIYIALDIGPIGELLEPMGKLTFDEAYDMFKRQVVQGVKSGVDLILIETMTDLYEAKAAVLAVKENSDLPVMVSMSFEANHRTFTGCLPSSMAITLGGLGVDALGINCSLGPKEIYPMILGLRKWTDLPIIVQPNAGLPRLVNGVTHYDITPDEFGNEILKFVKAGVRIIGGCCGTTPEFIQNVKTKIGNSAFSVGSIGNRNISTLCTASKTIVIDDVRVIGERINPTGKKLFKEALKNKDMDFIMKQGLSQVEAGAHILDVNVGLPKINEREMMIDVIKHLQRVTDVPLQIDSSDPKTIEAGLRYYNGKPIVNSVNGEDHVLDTILPLVKKYGAAVVGLTLDENGIPDTAQDRFKIAQKIVDRAIFYGIKREDVYIDALTLTVSAQQKEVVETIKTLTLVKDGLGVKTVLGVSNISFGLPMRGIINETFLSIALAAGLDLPIINPNDTAMMDKISAFRVLYNCDANSKEFIEKYSSNNENAHQEATTKKSIDDPSLDLKDIVVKGLEDEAAVATKELLKSMKELEIVNEYLIPALDIVGEQYENGTIFLPQLIQSAQTVKRAFDILRESLKKSESIGISKGKIILATVKGDIHDIGKNIVKVILENYNYEIIDLGKDVNVDIIVKEAQKYDEKIIVGLSALMTTTMKNMEMTIKALRNSGANVEIIVGGAVLTEEYAKSIGANYYAKDANDAVRVVKKIFEEN